MTGPGTPKPVEPTRRQPAVQHAHTRMQGAPGSEPSSGAPDVNHTRVQGADPGDGHTRLQAVPDATAAGVGLPPEIPLAISEEYEITSGLGVGGEARVYLATPRSDARLPEQVVVKIYQPGLTVDTAKLTKLVDRGAFRYMPRLYGFGNTTALPGHPERGWEVMEYLPEGSLHDYAERRGRSLPEEEVRAILGELTDALCGWDAAGWRQMDFSPRNILIRRHRAGDPELVIADFGSVVGTGVSQVRGDVLGNLRYLAPEAAFAEERSAESGWWSLGMIIHELLAGQLPAAWESARTQQALRTVVATVEPEVDQLPASWQLVTAGLLTRDKPYRWQATQVRAWLAGEQPEVRRGTAPAPKVRPLSYRGDLYTDPAALAVALADGGDHAVEWLLGRERALRDWLAQDFAGGAELFDRTVLDAVAGDRLAAARAVAALAATFVPETRPRYRGVVVEKDGLAALAARGDTDLLIELVQGEVLYESARHDGCADLRRVADELPRVVDHARQLCQQAGQPWHRAEAYREATLLIVDARAGRRRLPHDRKYAPDWWKSLYSNANRADTATVAGMAAVVAATLLAGAARAEIDLARSRPPDGAPDPYLVPTDIYGSRAVTMRGITRWPGWIAFVVWVGVLLGAAHALGFWFQIDSELATADTAWLWPEAQQFLVSEVAPPVAEFTGAHKLPDPLTDVVAPLLPGERDRPVETWLLACLPAGAMLLWAVSRRPGVPRWLTAPPALALSVLVLCNAYATGAWFVLVGVVTPTAGNGIGIGVLAVAVVVMAWVIRKIAGH